MVVNLGSSRDDFKNTLKKKRKRKMQEHRPGQLWLQLGSEAPSTPGGDPLAEGSWRGGEGPGEEQGARAG